MPSKDASVSSRLPPPPPKGCFGARHQLALLSFLGFFNVYALRVDLSIAMVAMVNQTAVKHMANETVSDCVKDLPNNGTVDDAAEGEFVWTPETQGIVLGSFFYGYICTQLIGGILAQRFGGKLIFGLGVFCTAALTLLTPLAARWSVGMLIALRIVEGFGEGVTIPAMHAMWSKWAPPLERSKLGTFCYSGMHLGTFAAMPISGLLCQYGFAGGWPSVFYVFGAFGCVWFVFWMAFAYDSPATHKFISAAEKDYIEKSIGTYEKPASHRLPIKEWLKSPPVYAVVMAHTCNNWGYYTMLTCMPTYMKVVLGFDIKKNSLLSAIPYAIFWAIGNVGGQLADMCRFRGVASTTNVRKSLTVLGLWVPAMALWGIHWVGCDHVLATALLMLSIGMNGLHLCGFFVNHLDIGPNHAGILLGISNTLATVPGMLGPYVVGVLTNRNQTRHQWQIVFYIAAAIFVFGAVFFVIFGSGERQHWDHYDDKSEKDSEIEEEETDLFLDQTKYQYEPLLTM